MTDETKQFLSDIAAVFDRYNAKLHINDGEFVAVLTCEGGKTQGYYFDDNSVIDCETIQRIIRAEDNRK